MELLTNKANVAASLQVAIGYDESSFNSFITEAQDFDLKKALPEKFYFDMLKNKEEEKYLLFLDGGEYTYEGFSYNFRGARKALDYFTYSRFVLNSSAVSTSHGLVVKTTPNSEPLSLEERKNIHYKKQSEANAILEEAILYILRNLESYPFFKDPSCANKKTNTFTTSVIK